MTSCRQRRRSPLGMVYPPRKRSPGRRSPPRRICSPKYMNRQSSNNYYYDGVGSPTRNFINTMSPKKISQTVTKPQQQTKPVEVSNDTKISSIKGLFNEMQVMSCKEMREYLNKTQLTVEEKIVFLESNNTGNKQLQSFIKKQHWSVTDLTFFSQGGKSILNTLSRELNGAASYMNLNSFDEKDEDCRYLNQLLGELKEEQRKKNPSQTTLGKIGAAAWWTIKQVGNVAGKAVNLAWSGVKWLGSKAFDLWNWISKDPKTAYFALLTLKTFKNKACRFVGSQIGYFGKNATFEYLSEQYYTIYKKPLPPKSTLDEAKELLYDIGNPILQQKLIKGTGDLIGKAFDRFSKGWTTGISNIVGAIPYVGPIVSAGLDVVMEVALDQSKEAIQLTMEQLAYQNNANNAFNMLFEVIDPRTCLDAMFSQQQADIEEQEKRNELAETTTKAEDKERKTINENMKADKSIDETTVPGPSSKGWFS